MTANEIRNTTLAHCDDPRAIFLQEIAAQLAELNEQLRVASDAFTSYMTVPKRPPVTATIPAAKRFLSDLEVEASYGFPRKTLQNWRVLGRGPIYRKFGDGVRYDVADLEAWIESRPTGGAGVPCGRIDVNVRKR